MSAEAVMFIALFCRHTIPPSIVTPSPVQSSLVPSGTDVALTSSPKAGEHSEINNNAIIIAIFVTSNV